MAGLFSLRGRRSQSETTKSGIPAQSARILVVDDESNIRLMVRLALEHAGHSVATAADGAEGLERFGDGQDWDLVLLDQRMPGAQGVEVLRKLKDVDPDAKVIMITAFGTIDLAVEAMRAGASDFLRKPFTADSLRRAVQAALRDGSPAGSAGPDSPANISFAMATLNGYRIETSAGTLLREAGDLRQAFHVTDPSGERRVCIVMIPSVVVELLKAHADCEAPPGGDRFWQALCEAHLANYLWQNSEFPPDGELRVEELTTSLRHWTDQVCAAASRRGG